MDHLTRGRVVEDRRDDLGVVASRIVDAAIRYSA
jgi:hypothetical protein